ncbi:MAG: hypothetical protein HY000_06085 [Planctomycetes bacterium]|nr:hypothetical protein [Planctomycetota bacterium]
MKSSMLLSTSLAVFCLTLGRPPATGQEVGVRDIGSRRELFVDHYLIDRLDGVRLQLQQPRPGGGALTYEQPGEGVFAFYTTVIKDGGKYRMYYRGEYRKTICYAESTDGIRWTKPELGLVEIDGSKLNNVLMLSKELLAPFLDNRPGVPPDERYKANIEEKEGLFGYVSADGLHWKKIDDRPIVPRKLKNHFDSQNVMFWSEAEQQYVLYARHSEGGKRAQARSTSKDFRQWTPQVLMSYSDTGSTVPSDHLYTSQVQPYFRAPHIYVSLPGRFMNKRRALSDEQAKGLIVNPKGGGIGDISDGVLLTSRAGSSLLDRTFLEGFVRPGIGPANWVSRTNYPACGIVQTGPAEMSIYVQRNYGQKTAHLERLALRLDGFASVHAPYKGGEVLTRPLRFTGKELEINYASSAAGGIRVEIQEADGKPLPGFALDDCPEIIGDEIEHVVAWKGGSDVGKIARRTVRLRFVMKDADLYSIRFR